MNIFLSYASAQRPLAEELCHRLQAAGHAVFFDREDLPPGLSYDDHIRQAIEACDLFVFLVTPESVADGRYTRTELKIAARRWPTPGRHVLPVLAAPTPIDRVPAYLRALNLLQPEGNLAAEVLLEVQERARAQAPAPAPAAPAPLVDDGGEGAAAPRYRSLELRFERLADGRYRADLGDGAAGSASAALAIDPAALEQGLWRDAVPIAGAARRGLPGAPASALPAAASVRAAGAALHALLFGSALGPALTARLREVDPQRGAGLRLVLDTTAAPELARLPWELLYSPAQEDFVFSDRFKPLVRRLAVDAPPPVLAVTPPLRLLVAVAAPADRPELQVGQELVHLDRALAQLAADGRLQTERLEHATLERLDDALLRWRPHVLHFIGHGDFDGGEGLLLLEAEAPPGVAAGVAAPIAGRQLAVLLRSHLGSLRLVFLNSCLGAAAAPRAAFGGVAQSLVRRGLPAVVAMQFPVPDAQAVGLARHFYRYLAAGQPVDAALTSARAFMVARGDEVCWAAPVLYLNAEDGRLFDIGPRPAGSLQEATPPAPPATAPTVKMAGRPPVLDDLLAPLQRETERVVVGAEMPPLTTARPAPSAPPGRALRWGALALPILLAAVLLAWWLLRPLKEAPPQPSAPPAVEPAVRPPPPDVLPAPAPAVPPPAAADAPVEAARAALRAGEHVAAARTLQGLLARDPQALGPARLGAAYPALAEELLRGALEAQARGDAAAVQALGEVLTRIAAGDPALQAWIGSILSAQGAGAGAGAGAAAPPVPAAPGAAAGWPIRVRPGDTLWGLAARFLGDGARWPELWRAHQERAAQGQAAPLPDPDRLRAGQVLWLPLAQRDGQSGLDYRVAPGDSLWRIAARVYGDARRWPLIRAANDLPHADRLVPGQRLRIPPAP